LFFGQCQKDKSIALPVLQKVFGQKLVLVDYHLNAEVCRALGRAMQGDAHLLTQIFIDNCGLTDETCATILDGTYFLESLQSFAIKGQEFGTQSIPKMYRLLDKQFPFQLQELKIIKCRIQPFETEALLDCLNRQSFIKTLVLMKVSFNTESLKKLCLFIERNSYLRQIDLSWNELSCVQYVPILHSLSANQYLTEINLSHN